MANPNIVAVTSIYGNTSVQNVTTSAAAIVTNDSSSGKVYKVNSLVVSNLSAISQTVTIDLYRNATDFVLGKTISIPASSSFTPVDKTLSLYLLEGDALRLTASNNSTLQAVCTFEEIS